MIPGVKDSQRSATLSHRELGIVTPLSVHDYLYSLAHTPNLKRFDSRRKQLLEGRPRLNRLRRIVHDAGSSTAAEARSFQHDQTLTDAMGRAQPPVDAEHLQQLLDNEYDGVTQKQTIHMAGLALVNPAVDGDQKPIEMTEGESFDANHLLKQLKKSFVQSSSLFGQQKYQESAVNSPMFVGDYTIDKDGETSDINGTNLGHGSRGNAPSGPPVRYDSPRIQTSSTDFEYDGTNKEYGSIGSSMVDKATHISVQSQQNLLRLSKRKPCRQGHKHSRRIVTYRNRNPLGRRQPTMMTHTRRRLLIDELELISDQVPSNPVHNSNAEATEYEDDPIQDFSSSPFKDSRRARNRHKPAKDAKKQKTQHELRQDVFKPSARDEFKYNLSTLDRMCTKTKEWLMVSMTCSDGFEGRERQQTGKTIPIRFPRRHPRSSRQALARVAELTFTSYRDIDDIIENHRTQQGEPFQSNAVTMFHHEENDARIEAFNPLRHQLLELMEKNGNKIYKPCQNSQLENLTKLQPPFENGEIPAEEDMVMINQLSNHKKECPVTFSKDVRVSVLQTLTSVSAPIAITNPCDSDESERYFDEEYPTYLAPPLDSSRSPPQDSFSLLRSKSMPLNHFLCFEDQEILGDQIAGNLEIISAFKHTASTLKRSLSQMNSTDVKALTRRMGIETGTIPV